MSTIQTNHAVSNPFLPTINREVEGQREINGKPSYTVQQAADVLTRTGNRWLDINEDGWTDVSYRMHEKAGVIFNAHGNQGFSKLDGNQQEAAATALARWSDVAKLRFTQAPPGGVEEGNIGFSNFTLSQGVPDRDGFATRIPPASTQRAVAANPKAPREWMTSEIYLDSTTDRVTTPSATNEGSAHYLHETGHALGLSHPHEDHPDGSSYETATYAQDSIGHSVMSYWGEHHTGQNFTKNGVRHTPSGPMVDDIAAIQKLYGANKDTRATDTTYGFNATADRTDYRLQSASDAPVFTVWDGGGIDTLDFSGFADDQLINLNAAQPSNVGGMVGNVFIAKGVSIENAKGGTGNDVFIPNRAQNVMTGNGGNNVYKYQSFKHSTPEKPDRITDFVSGKDKVDVSDIHRKGLLDSKTEGGHEKSQKVQRPVELVTAFTGRRNEAVLSYEPASKQARLEIDVKGNSTPGFILLIDSDTPLKPTDIVVSRALG